MNTTHTEQFLVIPGTNINIITNVEQFHKIIVTPAIASWLLARSTGNRGRVDGKLRPQALSYLEQVIQKGEWQPCHQGGAIDWNGRLFDGHHRLTAISRQGQFLPMWFKIGCNPQEDKVIDQGAARSIADITGIDRRITEVITLAAKICQGTGKVSPGSVRKIIENTQILEQVQLLLGATTAAARFYSSAPMKLAAVTRLLLGYDQEYILTQYKAMVQMDFDSMSSCSKALVRKVTIGELKSSDVYNTLNRGLVVFDHTKQNNSKIQIKDSTEAARMIRFCFGFFLDK